MAEEKPILIDRLLFFAGPVFILCGLIGMGVTLVDQRSSVRSMGWPMAPGEVVESRMDTKRDPGPTGSQWTDITYIFHVRYRYTVGSETFEGARVRFGGEVRGEKSEVQEMLARYPVGAKIEVFHDPDDPTDATLQKGSNTKSILKPFLVLVMVPMGLGLILFNRRGGRDRSRRVMQIGIMIGAYVLLALVAALVTLINVL